MDLIKRVIVGVKCYSPKISGINYNYYYILQHYPTENHQRTLEPACVAYNYRVVIILLGLPFPNRIKSEYDRPRSKMTTSSRHRHPIAPYKSNSWNGVALSQIRTLNSSTTRSWAALYYLFILYRECEPPTGS